MVTGTGCALQRDPRTSPEHVLPLQQLHDGRLRGGHDDDAAVLAAAHQAPLRGDVHAGRHPQRLARARDHAQLVDNPRRPRTEFIKSFLEGY